MKIAIVGSGVTGLVAARELYREHEIVLFEQHDYLGGHAHTVEVVEGENHLAVDTGFIVFNERNYPNFSRLLRELAVESRPSEMSFGVRCDRCGIEYSSRGVRGLLARPRQILKPSLYRMARNIVRFNRWARKQSTQTLGRHTIGDLRQEGLFARELFDHYLRPMTGAIWSASGQDVDAMPLAFVLRFYRNHGLLAVDGHPEWRTVVGGSRRYVQALVRPFRNRVRLRTPVRQIRRGLDHVVVHTDDGSERFDHVVLSIHTDQARHMLEDATSRERALLSSIPYARNEVVLHRDGSVLPRAQAARASWNCNVENCQQPQSRLRMTYDLRRLMRLDTADPCCVTVNDDGTIDPDRVLARIAYAHPVFEGRSLTAIDELRTLSGTRRTSFCGAYMGNGFHEDGVCAGLEAAQVINEGRRAA